MAKLLNIAHRGGARLWPENTLYAFAQAARAGCDGAELDLQLTRDGRLVVFHDYRLKPELCRSPGGRWLKGLAPKLKAAGANDDVLHRIMVDNPRRFLAFVPKKARKK